MSRTTGQDVVSQWAMIGALFDAAPTRSTPDLEQLLIDTARHVPDNPRLLIMAATWLSRYDLLIAKHRLAQMVGKLDDADVAATLGLILDTVRSMCGTDALDMVIAACRPALPAKPFYLMDRSKPAMAKWAQQRASGISKRWHLWAGPVELKPNSLRPLDWVMERNPSLQARAIFAGSLRTSILVSLTYDCKTGSSEAELARRCGVTRKAVHDALDHLELCCLIKRMRHGRNYQVTLASQLPLWLAV